MVAEIIPEWRATSPGIRSNGIDLADRAAGLRAKTIIISGYLFGLPAGAAARHETLMKPIKTFELVAAVQRNIGNAA
jgi:hypothetical protein